MMFPQTFLLAWLGIAAIPIVIHLLNRLRHRTVRWGAMMFLLKASRASVRSARLRHWLVLACRTAAFLAFALMLARPLAGGLVGRWLRGAPEEIVILLDRSASMNALDLSTRVPLREEALRRLAEVPASVLRGARITLIDSATLDPLPLADLEALPELAAAGPTDTSADLSALFAAASRHLEATGTGDAEVWVISDLQTSSWQPAQRAWPETLARLSALAPNLPVRILRVGPSPRGNVTLQLDQARLRPGPGEAVLELDVIIVQDIDEQTALPASLTLNGVRSPIELRTSGYETRQSLSLPLPPDASERGWGRLELPPDAHPGDNAVNFAWSPPPRIEVALRSEEPEAARLLGLAAAPDPRLGRTLAPLPSAALPPLDDKALLVWQGRLPPPETARDLTTWVEDGGVAVFLPPVDAGETAEVAPDSPLGLTWGGLVSRGDDDPLRIAFWEEGDGPLARTRDGRSLDLDGLLLARRRDVVLPPGEAGEGWAALATASDGQPAVLRRILGRGRMYAVTTLPVPEWSNLGRGPVLVPMLHRMADEGGARFAEAVVTFDGRMPASVLAEGPVVPVSGEDDPPDPAVQAGVYRAGGRMWAVNRPPAEDDRTQIEDAEALALFAAAGLPASVRRDLSGGRDAGSVQREIWRLFLILAVLFLVGESVLLLFDRARRPAPVATAQGEEPAEAAA